MSVGVGQGQGGGGSGVGSRGDTGGAFDASLAAPDGGLAKDTNWWGAFVIGLSGTILVTGIAPFAVQVMGASAIPYFVAVTAMGVILCFCLAELAAAFPNRTGGLPSYAYETMKPLGAGVARHLGGLSAWGYWLGWFTVTPINAILASGYIADLFGIPLGPEINMPGEWSLSITTTKLLIAAVIMVGMFIPCYLGIKFGAGFATVLGIAAIVPLTLVAILPFFKPSTLNWSNVSGFNLPEGTAGSLGFFMAWIFIMTWSVLAMEAAACYIGECRNPARDAKIALTAEGLFGFFIYVMIPLMFVAVLGVLEEFDPLTVFTDYAQRIFSGGFARWFIGLTLIVALLLSVLNSLMGCARSLYQNSQDGLLPRFFSSTNRHGVPDKALIFNLVGSFLLVFLGSPLEIYIFSNMGYLFAVAVSLIGYAVYRSRGAADPARPVRMPGFMGPLAGLIGLFFLFAWGYGGFYASDHVVAGNRRWLFFLGLALLALYFPLYLYRQAQDRKLSSSRTPSRTTASVAG